ncbi:MAG: YkgJ family cysteine cluster protein [Desulfatitalea sp.]|nr:YkgJ family cysteine cluster protein [Desulfatitalea sp.]NNK01902.1 YkgJ family cysteine cluster protein [Desulfatitalea sp.]
MKYLDESDQHALPGRPIAPGETFTFHCHPGIACFNQCCRHLNLFLYPYDVLRLSRTLAVSTDQFIDTYVDVVLRQDHYFPEVLLRMHETQGHPCVFLTETGCAVYSDRPHTCRLFPMEQGARFDAATGRTSPVYFFRPPEFCLGPHEVKQWTVQSYTEDQAARHYYDMTLHWAALRRRFASDPWGLEGPEGSRARMAFMAAYNLDRFRQFVFQSSFLKRYRIKKPLKMKLQRDDEALLMFGFEWIGLFVWGIPSKRISMR